VQVNRAAMVQLLANRQSNHSMRMKMTRRRKEQRVRYSNPVFTVVISHLNMHQ
jgi:hypothetical protein